MWIYAIGLCGSMQLVYVDLCNFIWINAILCGSMQFYVDLCKSLAKSPMLTYIVNFKVTSNILVGPIKKFSANYVKRH